MDADVLTLTDAASAEIVMADSGSNALSLDQAVVVSHLLAEVEHTLTLTDAADNQGLMYEESVESTLALTDSATVAGPIIASTGNMMWLRHEVELTIQVPEASNTLELTQAVTVTKPINEGAGNYLSTTLSHEMSVEIVRSEVVTDYITISDQASVLAGGAIQTASNHIELSDSARTVLYEFIVQIIQVTQDLDGWVPSDSTTADILDITQTVSPGLVANRSLTGVLTLTQAASGFIVAKGTWEDAPTLVTRSTTRLTYPYSAPTTTLDLRNPLFKNKLKCSYQRVNQQLRNGQKVIWRHPNWPKEKRITLKFDSLSVEQRVGLLDFLEESLGKEIGYLDYESRQWRGIVLTPNTQLTEKRYGGPNQAGHAVTLEFQGELV